MSEKLVSSSPFPMSTNNQDSTLCTAMVMSTIPLLPISTWSQALPMSSLTICQHTVINPVWFFSNSRLKESGPSLSSLVQCAPVISCPWKEIHRASPVSPGENPASFQLIPVSSHPPSQTLLPKPGSASISRSSSVFLSHPHRCFSVYGNYCSRLRWTQEKIRDIFYEKTISPMSQAMGSIIKIKGWTKRTRRQSRDDGGIWR